MDISTRTKSTLVQDDQTWIGNGGEPIGKPRSIVLDRSAFDLVDDFGNGFIPSGVVVAKETSTGLYVPYAGSPSEVQTVTVDATAGNFTLTFDGETTANISESATAAQVQTALEALSSIQPGDVTVTGSNGGPWTITFGGRYTGLNVPQITGTDVTLSGGGDTISSGTSTAGGPAAATGTGVARGLIFAAVPYDRDSTGNLGAALFWSGEVIESNLPEHHGLDAAARLALPHVAFVG
jgi:hypothetical protein